MRDRRLQGIEAVIERQQRIVSIGAQNFARRITTLQILWDEYIALQPDGYRYSRFCDLYRSWAVKLPVTMRQNHAAGDKLFVDYAGDTVTVVVDRLRGKTRQAHLFVAVLGASSLSYAEARWTETCPTGLAAMSMR